MVVLRRAVAAQIDPQGLLVVACLLEHLNDLAGTAYPSVPRLVEQTGLTPKAVRLRLKALVAAEVIADTGERVGTG